MLPTINRSVVVVTPKQPFVKWLLTIDPACAEIPTGEICKPTFYLLPGTDDDELLEEHLRRFVRKIFEDQLESWYTEPSLWPAKRDSRTFRSWFDYRTEAMLLDLWDAPLKRDS